MIFQWIRTSIAKKPYIFAIFQGGGADPLWPSLDPHMMLIVLVPHIVFCTLNYFRFHKNITCLHLCCHNRRSSLSARVFLNLLNRFNVRLFRNRCEKFNNTGARMLHSVYHRTLKLLKNRVFGVQTSSCCHLLRYVIMDVLTQRY